MHADRTNRVVLTFLGLLALAIGVAGLLAGYGAFGDTFRHRQLTGNRFSRYFGAHGDWLWPAIAAAAFLITILALLWLLRLLLSTDRTSNVAVERERQATDAIPGPTTLSSSALTDAVAAEIARYHGVTGASARVIGDTRAPTVVIDVSVTQQVRIIEVIRRIDAEAITHLHQALSDDTLPVQLNVTVNDNKAARAL